MAHVSDFMRTKNIWLTPPPPQTDANFVPRMKLSPEYIIDAAVAQTFFFSIEVTIRFERMYKRKHIADKERRDTLENHNRIFVIMYFDVRVEFWPNHWRYAGHFAYIRISLRGGSHKSFGAKLFSQLDRSSFRRIEFIEFLSTYTIQLILFVAMMANTWQKQFDESTPEIRYEDSTTRNVEHFQIWILFKWFIWLTELEGDGWAEQISRKFQSRLRWLTLREDFLRELFPSLKFRFKWRPLIALLYRKQWKIDSMRSSSHFLAFVESFCFTSIDSTTINYGTINEPVSNEDIQNCKLPTKVHEHSLRSTMVRTHTRLL